MCSSALKVLSLSIAFVSSSVYLPAPKIAAVAVIPPDISVEAPAATVNNPHPEAFINEAVCGYFLASQQLVAFAVNICFVICSSLITLRTILVKSDSFNRIIFFIIYFIYKYFPDNLNESYARQPEKIAARVYASRMGNGDETTKEGFKFRGRGYIQLTGKSNYTNFTKFIGEDCVSNPDLVANKYPLDSAAFFFN